MSRRCDQEARNTGSDRGAVISDCGKYRYRLWRQAQPLGSGVLCFLLLNPSTADANQDDPTLSKCIGFARRMNFRRVDIVNLFAYRSTKPKGLIDAAKAGVDIVGPDGDEHLRQAFTSASRIIAGWGNNISKIDRGQERRRNVVGLSGGLWSLAVNKSREPRHPLYIGYQDISQLAFWPP